MAKAASASRLVGQTPDDASQIDPRESRSQFAISEFSVKKRYGRSVARRSGDRFLPSTLYEAGSTMSKRVRHGHSIVHSHPQLEVTVPHYVLGREIHDSKCSTDSSAPFVFFSKKKKKRETTFRLFFDTILFVHCSLLVESHHRPVTRHRPSFFSVLSASLFVPFFRFALLQLHRRAKDKIMHVEKVEVVVIAWKVVV